MQDAILFSANLNMVDIDDAMSHLEEHKQLYWSVMFPINSERFSFPIFGFIHISGRQTEYRTLIDRIVPFSPEDFEGPRAEEIKPLSFRQRWASDPTERARGWKNDLVVTEFVPFSFNTRSFEKYPRGSGLVTQPPQKYVRVIPPNESTELNATEPRRTQLRTEPRARAQRPILEQNLEDFVVHQLDKIEAGLRLEERQFSTPAGRLDLLCRDVHNNFVVVELKRMRGSDQVVGQVLRYMGWLKEKRPEAGVRGIIIVGQKDEALRYAITAVPDIEVKEFNLTIT